MHVQNVNTYTTYHCLIAHYFYKMLARVTQTITCTCDLGDFLFSIFLWVETTWNVGMYHIFAIYVYVCVSLQLRYMYLSYLIECNPNNRFLLPYITQCHAFKNLPVLNARLNRNNPNKINNNPNNDNTNENNNNLNNNTNNNNTNNNNNNYNNKHICHDITHC